tara:strand:- start:483 stop:1418 length:936 start_codon:yes stop_codon:yes gene_type:complete
MKKKILITGSSGMVGKSLIRLLKQNNFILTPNSKELDLTNSEQVHNYLLNKKPSHIIHLAGYIGGLGASINEPINFLQENMLMGINLIKFAHKLKIKNFLNIGSSCIYEPNRKKPVKENQLLKGNIEVTNEGYGLAKISSIKLCEYISKNYNYNYFSLIPCNIYGPFDKFDVRKGHVIGSLIKKICLAKQKGVKTVEIWGSGKVKRELIYVDDVSRAILKFLFNKKLTQNKIYWINVGVNKDYKIIDIAKKIALILNYQGKFKTNLKMPDGAKSKLMNSKKIMKFGWKTKINLHNGLKKTIDWYKENEGFI